jgi:hypothetical protein
MAARTSKMKKPILMATFLGLMGAATAVQAGAWYSAKTYHAAMGGCEINNCALSNSSPAQYVKNNGATIEDGPDGEVDVSLENGAATMILFRTKKDCQAYVAGERQKEKEQEQEQDRELKKYQ